MAGIISAFTGDFISQPKEAQFLIVPVDDDGQIDDDLGGEKVLQYWPETLDESSGANWQSKGVPGAPLPIYQWISGAEHTFSFSAVFTRDMYGEIGKDVEEDKYNVDIDAAIAWLRMLSLNDYQTVADVKDVAVAPPVLWMYLDGTKLGNNALAPVSTSSRGGNNARDYGIYCLLLEVGAVRENWFQDGTVRKATVSLNFAETMQVGQGIYPYGRTQLKSLASLYNRRPRTRR